MRELTQQYVQELLSYDAETGVFYWRKKPHKRSTVVVGSQVGMPSRDGYGRIAIHQKLYLSHRIAWLYVYGEWPKKHIDHIDGNPGNNRIGNLRESSDAENAQNISLTSTAGAIWSKGKQKWLAKIRAYGVRHHLGYYETAEHARQAYLIAKIIVHRFQPTPRSVEER